MEGLLLWGGRAAGLAGLAMTASAVVLRLAGRYDIGPIQTGTLLLAGVAATAAGCFCLLWLLTARTAGRG
jgi:hypothetical protein